MCLRNFGGRESTASRTNSRNGSRLIVRLGSPRSESMLIPFLQDRGAALGTSCAQHFVQKVLVGYGHSSTDIHPGSSPPHISSLSRSAAGIHEVDSRTSTTGE